MDFNGFMPILRAFAFFPTVTGISLKGSSTTALLGQSFQFTCTVTSTSTHTFVIFKKGNALFCAVLLRTCQQHTASPGYICSCEQSGVYYMNITSVSRTDDGRWTCEHSQTSNNITLPVYYGPFNNVTVDKTSPVTLIEDVSVSLTARCSADCKPACSYIWMKGTQQLSESRYLPVGSFRRGQGGEYRCTARNTATGATAESQTLTVNVQWRPSMPTHNCPSWIVLGQTGSCTCQTSDRGNPAGTVQWIRSGGQKITASGSSSVRLNLTSIPRSDNGGNYICRANNYLPNSNRDIAYIASIAYLERLQLRFHKDETQGNTSITVTCTVGSNPIARMTVENIGSEAQPTSGITNILTVTAKSHCLHNKFRCTAENSQTKTQISTMEQLNVVLQAPEPPSWNILPVAAAEGVVIMMLIVVIVVILYKRSHFKGCVKKSLPGRYVVDARGEAITGQKRDDSCQSGRDVDGPLPAETRVETEADKQTYTELREFETTRDSPTLGYTAYESLQVRTPQVYEDIKQATHVHGTEAN